MSCQRCSDCKGMSHHWICDCADTRDPTDEDFDAGDYGCKHCQQRGYECPDCGGDGVFDSGGVREDGSGIDVPCERCKAEGVIAFSDEEYSQLMHQSVAHYTQYEAN